MSKRILTAIVVTTLALVLAGCGSSSGGSDSSKKDNGSLDKGNKGVDGSNSDTADASSCGDYTSGQNGVVRTFCDGNADVSFTIGGNDGKITGGECSNSGGYFAVNAGVVVDATFSGTKPDYAGFLLPEKSGSFTNDGVTATITTGGETTIIQKVSGTHDADGGSFTGTAMTSDAKVSVAFTC